METLSIYLSVLAVAPIFFLYVSKILEAWRTNYPTIPTIGYSNRLLSYISAIRWITHFREKVQEGYHKYPNGLYKIPTIVKWEVIVNGSDLINDMRKARGDELSFNSASVDNLHSIYNLKSGIMEDPYHVKVIQAHLSGNFGVFTPAMVDEAIHALNELIPLHGNEWTEVPALETMVDLIVRTTNRLFVGLPYCRNKEYLSLGVNFAQNLIGASIAIDLLPTFLHPILGPWISPYDRMVRKGRKLIGPLIVERLQNFCQYGTDWEGKPNDLLTWLIETASEEQRQVDNLIMRVLFLNFAGIHTTSMVLTHALFDLAAYPEYLQPLREEAEEMIEGRGWSKAAMSNLLKMDSFIRESMRISGVTGLGIIRKVIHPNGFTFSNGVTLPPGTFVAAPAYSVHRDPAVYEHPETFDGYRFRKLCVDEKSKLKYSAATTSAEYLPFGIGRHACPGRFFAMNEIKTLFAHFILNYDWKFDNPGGKRPDNQWIGYACAPNSHAKLWFRKRSNSLLNTGAY